MGKIVALWLTSLTLMTGGAYWLTKSNTLIPYAQGEKVIIREGNHIRSYFWRSGYRRIPTGGGPGHGK